MKTRMIERRGCRYEGIDEVVLRFREGKSLVFDVISKMQIKGGGSSGADMLDGRHGEGAAARRTLRIDVERPDIFRVRYAEGEQVPENRTAMLAVEFPGAEFELQEHDEAYEIVTGLYLIRITKNPYSLSVYDKTGVRKFAASIGEANDFKPLDAFNLGFVSGGGTPMTPSLPAVSKLESDNSGPDTVVSVESFELRADEHIYGLGEQFTGLDKRYQTIDLWTEDALGPVSQRTYKPIPFFVSSRGYGVFLNTGSPVTYWIGSLSNVRTVAAVEDSFMDYFVTLGETMKEAIAAYTDITGRGGLPPKWSFGLWLSKLSYRSEAECEDVVREMRTRRLPFDVLHLDTDWFEKGWICDLEFSKERFPDPERLFRSMKEQGVRVSLWQLPYFDTRNKLFQEADEGGFFPKKDGEAVYHYGKDILKIGVLDVTNPAMIEWWKEKLRKLFRLGASAIKVDFGEGAPEDCTYFDGTPGRRMHNLYPLLYNKILYDVTSEFTEQPLIWARSAWAGSQRYPIHWGGDNAGYFEQLVPQLAGGLSLMMSGFSFWSQDIGGFFSNVRSEELYVRWFQIGLFMTHPRLHGIGDREPYRFGEEVETRVRELLDLRYRLLPYIYSTANDSVNTGIPFMRPMPLAFEHDPAAAGMVDQFMFGPALLVAPFMEQGGERTVYLPEGEWYDFWSGVPVKGGTYHSVKMGLDRFPLYVRGGSIIPMGPELQYTGEKTCDPITLLLYPDGESRFEYYDDHESFSIQLSDRKLTIGHVSEHHFHIRIHTASEIIAVSLNGSVCDFQKEPYGFSMEANAAHSITEIEWR